MRRSGSGKHKGISGISCFFYAARATHKGVALRGIAPVNCRECDAFMRRSGRGNHKDKNARRIFLAFSTLRVQPIKGLHSGMITQAIAGSATPLCVAIKYHPKNHQYHHNI